MISVTFNDLILSFYGYDSNSKKNTKMAPIKKTIRQNNLNINGHILEACVHILVKDEVSMPAQMDRRACKRKLPKWLPLKN